MSFDAQANSVPVSLHMIYPNKFITVEIMTTNSRGLLEGFVRLNESVIILNQPQIKEEGKA